MEGSGASCERLSGAGPRPCLRTYLCTCDLLPAMATVLSPQLVRSVRRIEVDRRESGWVRDAQRGSAAAIEHLFRSHWPRAHRAALLVVGDAAAAEDIAQESFLAAVRALDRFDRRRPFGPWLHRIVVNRSIDWARARALRRELSADDAPEPAAREREEPGEAHRLAARS